MGLAALDPPYIGSHIGRHPLLQQFSQCFDDAPSLAQREIFELQKAGQQVEGNGQPAAGGEIAPHGIGTDEVQRRRAIEAAVDAGAAAEVQKLGAAAQGDVLAIVDPVAGLRIDERACPAAKRFGLFQQFDPSTALGKRHGRGQSRPIHRRQRRPRIIRGIRGFSDLWIGDFAFSPRLRSCSSAFRWRPQRPADEKPALLQSAHANAAGATRRRAAGRFFAKVSDRWP